MVAYRITAFFERGAARSNQLVGALFPLLVLLFGAGLERESLLSGRLEWIAYQGALAALLTLVVGSGLAFTRPLPRGNRMLALAGHHRPAMA